MTFFYFTLASYINSDFINFSHLVFNFPEKWQIQLILYPKHAIKLLSYNLGCYISRIFNVCQAFLSL